MIHPGRNGAGTIALIVASLGLGSCATGPEELPSLLGSAILRVEVSSPGGPVPNAEITVYSDFTTGCNGQGAQGDPRFADSTGVFLEVMVVPKSNACFSLRVVPPQGSGLAGSERIEFLMQARSEPPLVTTLVQVRLQ
jgi:hypothetical protein